MNRTLLMGIMIFLAFVGICLMGENPQAVAGHGCHGYYACHGCSGYACVGCSGCRGVRIAYRSCYASCACSGYRVYHRCRGYVSACSCYGSSVQILSSRDTETRRKVPVKDPKSPVEDPKSSKPTVEQLPDQTPLLPPADDSPKAPTEVTPPFGTDKAKPAEPKADPFGDTGILKTSGLISINVPADAKIFVNGRPTASTGSVRQFLSRNLQRGLRYKYEIRAEIIRGTRVLSETKVVKLTAGERTSLDFALSSYSRTDNVAQAPVQTTLSLHVPTEAEVYLAGRRTQKTGTLRQFSTTKLAAGDKWNDYKIRVELSREGQRLVRHKTITLSAGQTHEVHIDFEGPEAARLSER